jgi:hypothetical protein
VRRRFSGVSRKLDDAQIRLADALGEVDLKQGPGALRSEVRENLAVIRECADTQHYVAGLRFKSVMRWTAYGVVLLVLLASLAVLAVTAWSGHTWAALAAAGSALTQILVLVLGIWRRGLEDEHDAGPDDAGPEQLSLPLDAGTLRKVRDVARPRRATTVGP